MPFPARNRTFPHGNVVPPRRDGNAPKPPPFEDTPYHRHGGTALA